MAKKTRQLEAIEAIEAINRAGQSGWRGYLRDAAAVAGTGAVGAVTLGATAALMAKTPVGGWLGRWQAPALMVAGAGIGPVVGLLNPYAGLGVGAALFLTGLYSAVAELFGLPTMQASAPAAAAENAPVARLGVVFSGGRYALGAGSMGRDELERELLNKSGRAPTFGLVRPQFGAGPQMAVVNPRLAGTAPPNRYVAAGF